MALTDMTNKKPGNNNDKSNNNNQNNGNNNPFGSFGGIQFAGFPGFPGMPGQNDADGIEDLFINYNDKYKTKPPVLFREKVIEQLLSILIGKDKPNAILVGPAGVGKTAIVETLAGMIENDDPMIPDQIKDFTIWELPLANVVAGATLVGQLEENVKQVVAKMEDPDEKAILFIDEIHQLLGGSQIYDKIAQILKPALARGNLHVIGATTLQEASNLMKDPAFNRRFSKVIVDELTRPQTIEILKNAKTGFINHYKNIIIDDDLLTTVAILADQYRPAGSHRPDNALTLLDRTIGEAVINRKVQLTTLYTKIQDDPNDTDSQNLYTTLLQVPTIPITNHQVRKTAISLATGNSKRDTIDMDRIRESFKRIKGQDDATTKVIQMLERSDNNLFPKVTPTTMLFIGPSGVGKTEIAKMIAKEMTGQKPIILNMTEYSEPATINRIIGSPAGYVGSDSKAELPFDELESNPYAVILLDEFEKAHASVQRLFYTVFDEGTLTDNHGKTIDFSKSVIIATTNAGYQEMKKPLGFGSSSNSKNATINELSRFFDTALLNRFNYLIYFNTISKDIYKEIISDTYEREVTRILIDNPNLKLTATLADDVLDKLVEDSYHAEFGARPAFATVKAYIEDQIYGTP